jgi:phytoene dehydrogenase-like protein
MSKKVVVIGGGLGSLSGAIHLARMGFNVQLFEQNDRLGGKVNELVLGSYRFDTGPTLLTMDFIIDDLFRSAGFNRFISLSSSQSILSADTFSPMAP